MKLKLLAFLSGFILLLASCGEESEFGFNVSKEVDLSIPVDYETGFIQGFPLLDPPAATTELDLEEIDAFSGNLDDLNSLGSIVINSIAYSITGVSASEQTELDELTITAVLDNGERIELLNLTGELRNVPKTNINLSATELETLRNALLGNRSFTTEVKIDFSEVPDEDISATVDAFFDITLKIRS